MANPATDYASELGALLKQHYGPAILNQAEQRRAATAEHPTHIGLTDFFCDECALDMLAEAELRRLAIIRAQPWRVRLRFWWLGVVMPKLHRRCYHGRDCVCFDDES